jgi:glycosyltransferase involved in cell wall biosynthesis
MTIDLHLLLPGSPDQRTGGYLYDRRIVEGLRALGRSVAVHPLPGRYPAVDAATVRAAEASLVRLPDGALTIIDALALPGVASALPEVRHRLRLVALVHHPASEEPGLAPTEAARLRAIEATALGAVQRVIVTSPFTARVVARLGVPAERIAVVVPGVDPAPPRVAAPATPPLLLCVATVTRRKGHLVLIEAFARIADLAWTLVCIGSLEREPDTAGAVRAAIEARGLSARIDLAGERAAAQLGAQYRRASLFVLASYYEGYGMVLAEALAHGLPIVATAGGAVSETVPEGAGLLVPPGDAAALAAALRCALSDDALYRRLAACATAAAATLPRWSDAAGSFAAELDRLSVGWPTSPRRRPASLGGQP